MRVTELSFVCGRILMDFLSVWFGMKVAYWLRISQWEILGLESPLQIMQGYGHATMLLSLALVGLFALHGRYNFGTDRKFLDEFRNLFWVFSGGVSLVLLYFFFAQFAFFSRFVFAASWALGFSFLILGRILLRSGRGILYRAGYGKTRVVLIGQGEILQSLEDHIKHTPQFEHLATVRSMEALQHAIANSGIWIDEILLATEESHTKLTDELVRIAHRYQIRFRFIPDGMSLDLADVHMSNLGPFPMVSLLTTRLTGWNVIGKNLIDRIGASIALILLSPLLLWIAYRVKKEYPGAPIIYRSQRVGKNKHIFTCYKFRSMVPDAEAQKVALMQKNERADGVLFKMTDDPRITKFGHFIRTTSLDELPNLWNVVKGDMSLVGPRPHQPDEVEKYERDDLRIFSLKPGITGYAQINGRSKNSFREEMRYELYYMHNWSFWGDIVILWKTLWVVLKKENVA